MICASVFQNHTASVIPPMTGPKGDAKDRIEGLTEPLPYTNTNVDKEERT